MLKAWCWWSCWEVVTPVRGGGCEESFRSLGVSSKEIMRLHCFLVLVFCFLALGRVLYHTVLPTCYNEYHKMGLRQQTNQLWTATFQTGSPNKPLSFVNELVQIFCELTLKTWKLNSGTNSAKGLCFALQSCFF